MDSQFIERGGRRRTRVAVLRSEYAINSSRLIIHSFELPRPQSRFRRLYATVPTPLPYGKRGLATMPATSSVVYHSLTVF